MDEARQIELLETEAREWRGRCADLREDVRDLRYAVTRLSDARKADRIEIEGKIETLREWLLDHNRHEEFQKLCELLGKGK